jgi:ADP-ribose pyrophosphatase
MRTDGMTRQIYRGRVVDLRVERVTLPNGMVVELELMRHPGAAAVAAVDERGRVVLIRQYRHAAGGYLWELPAGVLAASGEAPAACAARELREEAGLTADRLEPLGSVLTTPGFCDERIHLFLARGLHEVAHAREADEVITEIARVPLDEATRMVRAGAIVDGKTVAGVFLAAAALGGQG